LWVFLRSLIRNVDILILRHGIAEDPADAASAGRSERERTLTEEGIRKTTEVCGGLAALIERIDHIFTSPLVRARQTAQILAEATDCSDVSDLAALEPAGSLSDVCTALGGQGTVAVVGHEPDLGILCGLLLTGDEIGLIELKKAGAVLVRCDEPGRGGGELIWALPPRVSQALA
jgi:phosphohistidine phosphatase